MREEVVTPATARVLQRAGLPWDPQLGDWCVILGGEVVAEAQSGLWLVAALAPQAGLVGLMDAASKWPMARVAVHDCLWLPTAGKLKMWLRAQGYRVATGETDPMTLGAGARHVCKATSGSSDPQLVGDGPNEAEAVAATALRALASRVRSDDAQSDAGLPAREGWIELPNMPTRRF
jgi:hypothetical protein